jgi:hypothetical protein
MASHRLPNPTSEPELPSVSPDDGLTFAPVPRHNSKRTKEVTHVAKISHAGGVGSFRELGGVCSA